MSERGVQSGLQRLEAFSDGVMAVIITISAFEIKPPAAPTAAALAARMPSLLVYALSFVMIGIYWNNHHHLLRTSHRLNASVMWANFLLLFWLSLIPVLTAWLAANYKSSLPAALWGADALLAGNAYFLLVRALIRANGRDSALARAVQRDIKGLVSVGVYAVAVAAAFLTPWLAYALYVLVAVIWVAPDPRLLRSENPG